MEPIKFTTEVITDGGRTRPYLVGVKEMQKLLEEAEAANANPRPKSKAVVDYYAAEMAAGRFECSTIYFDESGLLVDGQHRGYSAVQAKKDLLCWIIKGLSHAEVMGLDQGKKRGVSLYLKAEGQGNATTLCAALRVLNCVKNGLPVSAVGSGKNQLSTSRAFELLESDPGMAECVSVAAKAGAIAPASIVATCGYIGEYSVTGQSDELMAFCDGLSTGAGLNAGDPRLALRNRILADRSSKSRLTRSERDALIVIAWNRWIVGGSCKILRWHNSAPFPAIETIAA